MGGVNLQTSTDYNIVTANRFRGCTSGITDASGGTHNFTAGNVGP